MKFKIMLQFGGVLEYITQLQIKMEAKRMREEWKLERGAEKEIEGYQRISISLQ